MAETIYDKINDYGSVSIRLASPEDIRVWSSGEVKKPETINYRTYRSERDGLFCERIFGPERDWECFCGKYKGIKYKGTVCDRCGVTVTHSKLRRKRMGHITLAAPVAHIWFFKAMPSRLGALLDMKTTSLERVVYYQGYIVTDPMDTPLKQKQLLTEEEYRSAVEEYGATKFKAGMGAEGLKEILRSLKLDELSTQLRQDLIETKSKQKAKDLAKRLRIVEALRDSHNQPEWMILDVVPVIPPDLRPLVLLESGNFATSDLNDLYRRLINRNNRLKKLLELNAPEVIIRNEKRMLQQAADALFDNSRCRRPVLGSNNRPLKSLTDMIKGKQGRFRENLLGKRVDYSARSVIVVGPELKLHQCGLPKKIALELYQPFIIRRLKELGYAETIKSAKKMLERKDEEVWDILEEVIDRHPVLLNRAPTLHRMGIQAFEPILIEGNAIMVHPLVCEGFNADFDGDQMAVHLPLSMEARIEASTLMLASSNIFSPSDGRPIIAPSQDIVLGCFYMTIARDNERGEGMVFASKEEALMAYAMKKISTQAKIRVRIPHEMVGVALERTETLDNSLVETTVGRIIFNDILPDGMPFYNFALSKKAVGQVISDCHRLLGTNATLSVLDGIKEFGFKSATRAGLSFAKDDLRMPSRKAQIIQKTEDEVEKIQKLYEKGVITDGERYNQVVDCWTHSTEVIGEEMMKELRDDTRGGKAYLNPIYCMVESGARGSLQQVRQLAGMRGLMAKPSGRIIETPIKANFREGLQVLEYFSSTHGARKGLADTALKTADSGYLTRKLADVAQNVVINEDDCGTLNGIPKSVVYKGEKVEVPLAKRITGRTARDTIVDIVTDEVIVRENELITRDIAERLESMGFSKVSVRSPLTCETELGLCAKCYGMDRSRGKLVEEGLAVGIIAAQSIGEPGTQLTMRTFHMGGTASRSVEESEIRAKVAGIVRYVNLKTVVNQEGERVVLNRNGEVDLLDDKGRELDKYGVPSGSILMVEDGAKAKIRTILLKWDPHMIPICSEMEGVVSFEDIEEGKTMREEVDNSGIARKMIIEHKGDRHPQILIKDKGGDILGVYPIPEKAYLEVTNGEAIMAGTLLAKTPREMSGTQDITGGLPRVTELFEARRPKDPSVIAEVDGVVELGEKKRGKRTIVVRPEHGEERVHLVPHGKHVRVHKGDRVKAGEPLVDGPLVPQDILRISGEEVLQTYLLREIQNVYRSQNVTIDDKHVEIIVAQMLRKVLVESQGDTDFLPGEIADRFQFRKANDALAKGAKAALAGAVLLGITKASLHSDSFIAAASFQETTKVLTEAAIAGKVDQLLGLKENVILGHMVPTGTGFKAYFKTDVKVHPSLEEATATEQLEPPRELEPVGETGE